VRRDHAGQALVGGLDIAVEDGLEERDRGPLDSRIVHSGDNPFRVLSASIRKGQVPTHALMSKIISGSPMEDL